MREDKRSIPWTSEVEQTAMEDLDNLDIIVRDASSSWKRLDSIDVKILEGITRLGPRNLLQVGELIQVPHATVRFRLKRMLESSNLFLHLVPNTNNMGLKRAVVFIEAATGCEFDLLDFLKVNDFWVFLCPIYGKFEGYVGIWTIPCEKVSEFNAFLLKLQEIEVARDIECIWTTPFHSISVSSRWFDSDEKTWLLKWSDWIEEIENIEDKLPSLLCEPKDWPMEVDYTDLSIIAELENDAILSLSEISKILDLPRSTIKYHFYQHIQRRDLIGGYSVEIYRYPFPICEILFFKFDFDSYEKMRKFALSLLDKPIAISMGKVHGENSLISHIFLPKRELRRFIRALVILVKKGLMKSYHYYIQDMYRTMRETIPFEHFKNGEWSYSLDDQLKKIDNLLRNGN